MLKSQKPLPLPSTIAESTESVPLGELFTYKEVAAALKLTPQTVMEWVKKGMVCSPLYFGSSARFTRQMLDAMLLGPSIPGMHAVSQSPRATAMKKAHAKKKRINAIWSKPDKTGARKFLPAKRSNVKPVVGHTKGKIKPGSAKRKGGK